MHSWSLVPPFTADGRGNKLKRFAIRDHKGDTEAMLMLCGPDEVAAQIVAIAADRCRPKRLTEKGQKNWTHAFHFPEGVSQDVAELCDNLTDWLTIPQSQNIDLSLSLDWYKQPGDDDDLVLTRAGQLISWTKYAKYPQGSSSRQARKDLLTTLAGMIEDHPLLAGAEVVSSPPGSKGDGTSFGEQLGRDVAAKAGRRFVPMNGPARAPQKEEIIRDVRDDFNLTEVVHGPVLLVDDVFHTGVTLESAALAARRAGATSVVALTAARTLRK